MERLNDETILAALISCGSVRRAAKVADCSETTIRARLADTEFKAQYTVAKAAILDEACDALTARLTRAIDTLCDVLDNTENAATVRVSAADALLRHGLRYVEVANIIARLAVLEAKAQEEQHERNY